MPKNKNILLVDTCIISHALTPNQTPAYVGLFEKLEKKYLFAVTGFTKYEIMRSSDKTHRKKIEEYIEQNMAYATLSQKLMDFSARLCYLYKKHASTKNHKIPTGDIINGAFSICKPSPILTIDNNDYPTPFFKEIDRIRVNYKSKKDKDTTDTVYVLEPDIENTKNCFKSYKV